MPSTRFSDRARESLLTDTRGEKMSRYVNARKLGHGQLARDTSDESRSLRDGTRGGNAGSMTNERVVTDGVEYYSDLEVFGQ
jgi:hypothetical protein